MLHEAFTFSAYLAKSLQENELKNLQGKEKVSPVSKNRGIQVI